MEELANDNNGVTLFLDEGKVVQYALKNCSANVKTIAKKLNLTIGQMAQICNGEHPVIEDYVSLLSYCLKIEMLRKGGNTRRLIMTLHNNGLDFTREDVHRLVMGESSNPLEYDIILHIFYALPIYTKTGKQKKKSKDKSLSTSTYYKLPYVKSAEGFNRDKDFEYGLTDT